jgi:hypothetical protein
MPSEGKVNEFTWGAVWECEFESGVGCGHVTAEKGSRKG